MNEEHKDFLAAMAERLSVSRYDCGTEYPVMIRGEMMETFCDMLSTFTSEDDVDQRETDAYDRGYSDGFTSGYDEGYCEAEHTAESNIEELEGTITELRESLGDLRVEHRDALYEEYARGYADGVESMESISKP